MANPVYDITFQVNRAVPSVTPTVPQRAGYYGDDGFAVVRFVLSNTADAADHQFRIEIVDGNGAYDVTELLTLQNGAITYTVPQAWTAAGVAMIRLVEIEIGDDGTETAVLHYPPAQLFFEAREDGTAMGEMLPAWQKVMTETELSIKAATDAAENANAACERSAVAANNAAADALAASQNATQANAAAAAAAESSDKAWQAVGDIDTALDEIIAIQEGLIGGAT